MRCRRLCSAAALGHDGETGGDVQHGVVYTGVHRHVSRRRARNAALDRVVVGVRAHRRHLPLRLARRHGQFLLCLELRYFPTRFIHLRFSVYYRHRSYNFHRGQFVCLLVY